MDLNDYFFGGQNATVDPEYPRVYVGREEVILSSPQRAEELAAMINNVPPFKIPIIANGILFQSPCEMHLTEVYTIRRIRNHYFAHNQPQVYRNDCEPWQILKGQTDEVNAVLLDLFPGIIVKSFNIVNS